MGDIPSLTSDFDVQRGVVQKVHLQRVLIAQWMRMPRYHLAHQCHLLLVGSFGSHAKEPIQS